MIEGLAEQYGPATPSAEQFEKKKKNDGNISASIFSEWQICGQAFLCFRIQ